MDDKLRARIEKATVSFPDKLAKGVLIKNNMILTASHCVKYKLSGKMDLASGENYHENIQTWSGNLKIAPLAIEPVSDIAVLGTMDDQEFESDYEEYDYFCKNTSPMKISKKKIQVNERFKIHVFTHKLKWIEGYAYISHPDSYLLLLDMDDRIKKGTSGSGVYNDNGEIVGIVSKGSLERNFAAAVRPIMALPIWLSGQL